MRVAGGVVAVAVAAAAGHSSRFPSPSQVHRTGHTSATREPPHRNGPENLLLPPNHRCGRPLHDGARAAGEPEVRLVQVAVEDGQPFGQPLRFGGRRIGDLPLELIETLLDGEQQLEQADQHQDHDQEVGHRDEGGLVGDVRMGDSRVCPSQPDGAATGGDVSGGVGA